MNRSLTLSLQHKERIDNASKEKMCPIYKMMCSFSKPVMDVELGSLFVKHNRTVSHQVIWGNTEKQKHYS